MVRYKNVKTKEWTPQYAKFVARYQNSLKSVSRLYNYDWDDEKQVIREIATREYRLFKDKWRKEWDKFYDNSQVAS